MTAKAKIMITCKHDYDGNISLVMGPHIIDTCRNENCKKCYEEINALIDELYLLSQINVIGKLLFMRKMIRISIAFNIIFVVSLLVWGINNFMAN